MSAHAISNAAERNIERERENYSVYLKKIMFEIKEKHMKKGIFIASHVVREREALMGRQNTCISVFYTYIFA